MAMSQSQYSQNSTKPVCVAVTQLPFAHLHQKVAVLCQGEKEPF